MTMMTGQDVTDMLEKIVEGNKSQEVEQYDREGGKKDLVRSLIEEFSVALESVGTKVGSLEDTLNECQGACESVESAADDLRSYVSEVEDSAARAVSAAGDLECEIDEAVASYQSLARSFKVWATKVQVALEAETPKSVAPKSITVEINGEFHTYKIAS